MSALSDLPNIGTTLAQKLISVGIDAPEKLLNTGSKEALIRIATLDNNGVCLNMFYALEGAIQGIRWHGLNMNTKQELKELFNLLNLSN